MLFFGEEVLEDVLLFSKKSVNDMILTLLLVFRALLLPMATASMMVEEVAEICVPSKSSSLSLSASSSSSSLVSSS